MKIIAVSDLHGNLINIDECDTLLICGDISPLQIQRDHIKLTKWFFNDFYKWIIKLKCTRVILVPGNHDFWFEKFIEAKTMYFWDKLTILINGELNIREDGNKQIKIFGTPFCKMSKNWAYGCDNKELFEYFKEIPSNVDILIAHQAPSIETVGYDLNGIDWGSAVLTEAIEKKKPKFVFCGHIHDGDHNLIKFKNSSIVNCSILNDYYNVNYKPFEIEI